MTKIEPVRGWLPGYVLSWLREKEWTLPIRLVLEKEDGAVPVLIIPLTPESINDRELGGRVEEWSAVLDEWIGSHEADALLTEREAPPEDVRTGKGLPQMRELWAYLTALQTEAQHQGGQDDGEG